MTFLLKLHRDSNQIALSQVSKAWCLTNAPGAHLDSSLTRRANVMEDIRNEAYRDVFTAAWRKQCGYRLLI